MNWAEMRMIRWMCGVKLRNKTSCIERSQQLLMEDIVKVIQRNRLLQYRHVLRKNENDLVEMCYFGA